MPNFVVRPAVKADAAAIARIHAEAGAVLRDAAPGMPQRVAFWRDAVEFGEPQVQVACDGDTVVGFVGFDRSRDKRTPPTMGEIWAIYVVPSHWDKGIGLQLWDTARELLVEEGCTDVSIWIELASERALRFHELAGFKRDMPSLRTVPKGNIRVEELRLKRSL